MDLGCLISPLRIPTVLSRIVCSTFANMAIVAHWTFDEVGWAIAADSLGTFDGTLAGGATFVGGGISGNAISLTTRGPGGDFVNVGNAHGFDGFNDFSVST
ncbi:MAG: hypothetical protein ACI915_002863 [Gammaproteobacteria bacterium]|jgi:hypothetical protein